MVEIVEVFVVESLYESGQFLFLLFFGYLFQADCCFSEGGDGL